MTAVCKQFAFLSGMINHISHSIASGSGKRLAKCTHIDHANRSGDSSGCGSNNVDTNTHNYYSPCAELHRRRQQLSTTPLSSIACIVFIAFIRSYFSFENRISVRLHIIWVFFKLKATITIKWMENHVLCALFCFWFLRLTGNSGVVGLSVLKMVTFLATHVTCLKTFPIF